MWNEQYDIYAKVWKAQKKPCITDTVHWAFNDFWQLFIPPRQMLLFYDDQWDQMLFLKSFQHFFPPLMKRFLSFGKILKARIEPENIKSYTMI